MIPLPAFLSVTDMAAQLGVSTKTIRCRLADGGIRHASMGGRTIRIPASELYRLSGLEPPGSSDQNDDE